MAFQKQELVNIFAEIQRRQREAGRLSLVEFDDAEYQTLESWARRIVQQYERWTRQPGTQRQVRLIFLAFTMNFVQRYKNTDDELFWPDFERVLRLATVERRLIEDLLWDVYQEEGVEQTYDGRGRRIVGSLLDEMREAEAWVTQARQAFVQFFIWYYRRHPGEVLTAALVKAYNQQSRQAFAISDKVLGTLSHDCQALVKVLDYALEHELYLDPRRLEEYRRKITAVLGEQFDPAHLRLIRGNEQALIRLILELQNHRTPAQLAKELQARRQARVTAPWGKSLPVGQALRQWTPFAYGVYRVDSQEYRVVPYSQLRLEMIDEWPLRQVVLWRNYLGYKSDQSFQVIIGRREIVASPCWRSENHKQFVWVGAVPVGEKLIVDGRLRSESTGANWQTSLVLLTDDNGHFVLGIAIERLVLYYPDRPHQPITIQTNTNHQVIDHLRQDGSRRFHRHGDLTFQLPHFDDPVYVEVIVADERVLQRAFEPPEAYLFSQRTRQQIQAQTQADIGDSVYILFTRSHLTPQADASIHLERLPYVYGDYHVYQATWEKSDQPFALQAGEQSWAFATRREIVPILSTIPRQSHVRLQPHQAQRFADVSLHFYSTWDLFARPLKLEVWDTEDLVFDCDLSPYLSFEGENLYQVKASLFDEIERAVGELYGRHYLLIRQNETLLDELRVTLMPTIRVVKHDSLCLEDELYHLTLETAVPAWNPITQQANTQVQLAIRPKLQTEPWPEHRGRQRLYAQSMTHPVAFPGIGESLELTWQPDVFGARFYLKNSYRNNTGKWVTTYQPVTRVDYYRLKQTILHLFSLPEKRLEIRSGAYLVWQGETGPQGQLLVEDLSFLRQICTDEWTSFTVRCHRKDLQLMVRWTPRLESLSLTDNVLLLSYEGPSGTGLIADLRDDRGGVLLSRQFPCGGKHQEDTFVLPSDLSVACVTVTYQLSDGTTRPTIHEVRLPGKGPKREWEPWLELGLGVADEALFSLLVEGV